MIMGLTVLNVLWLLPAFTLATEMVGVNVSPQITAEYGQPVTLQCNVTSKSPRELEVKYMGWYQNKMFLCSVNSEGIITTHNRLTPFRCEYKNQQLSLIFPKVEPMESGSSKPYMCKLRSNQGESHAYMSLELEEGCGTVEGFLTSLGPACTFKHVYPDADVHWFHGSHRITDESLHNTTKRVEEGGWLTIQSCLHRPGSAVAYNCSLKSSRSDRYIASALVERPQAVFTNLRGHASSLFHSNEVTPVKALLYISVLLFVTVK